MVSNTVKKKSKNLKKQLAFSRLFHFNLKSKKRSNGGRRARQIYLPIGLRKSLQLSLRNFRTAKNKRSKHKNQFVIKVYGLALKEVAVTKVRRPRQPKKTKQKISFSWLSLILMLIGITGAIYFTSHLHQRPKLDLVAANSIPAPADTKPKITKPTTLPKSLPVELIITRIDIDADLVSVGQNSDGSMRVPTTPRTAGWYNQGPTPGQLGPSIIVGHVDSQTGISIFWRLREVVPGDIVTIKRADTKVIKFKVNAVKQFPVDKFPTNEVYGNINYAGIRLITCGGVFNAQTGHYNLNTVVFGTLIDPKTT